MYPKAPTIFAAAYLSAPGLLNWVARKLKNRELINDGTVAMVHRWCSGNGSGVAGSDTMELWMDHIVVHC